MKGGLIYVLMQMFRSNQLINIGILLFAGIANIKGNLYFGHFYDSHYKIEIKGYKYTI